MKNYLDFINRAFTFSFYAVFFLTPLILYPKTFELFEFNKLWVTFGIVIFILFLWVSKMIVTGKFIFRRTPFDIPIALFLCSQIISTLLSIEPHTSFWGYYGRFNGGLSSLVAYIFLYFAFLSNFSNNEDNVTQRAGFKMLIVSLITGVAVALWGFSSHFGYDLTCFAFRGTLDVSCWTDSFQPTVRLFSTLGQPNWLAAYFSILIPVSLALGTYKLSDIFFKNRGFSFDRNSFIGFSFAAVSVLLFVELLWTESQSGYAGLLVGLAFYIAMVVFLIFSKTQRLAGGFKSIFTKATVFILIVLFVFSFFTSNTLQEKIPILSFSSIQQMIAPAVKVEKKTSIAVQPVGELGGSDSGKIRLAVWKGAIEIFRQHPLFGTGVETFAYAYYKVKPIEHNLLSEWDFLYNKAHNEYLNYLATTGAFGLGTYLLIIFSVMFYGISEILKLSKSKIEKPEDLLPPLLIASLLAGYISILISNFFGFSVVVINIYFFIIPAFLITFSSKKLPVQNQEYLMKPLKMVGIIVVGIVCIFLELYILNIWFADQDYALGYNLDRAQEYVMANPYLEDAVKLFPEEDLYKSELSLNLATLGLLFYQQNQKDHGDEFVKRAKAISDYVVSRHPQNMVYYKTRIQLLFELSQIDPKSVNNAYYTEAINAINYAQTLGPTDAKIAYNAGLLYGQAGNIEKAKEELRKSITLKSNYREPRYALGVYLIQEAKDEKDPQIKQKELTEAKNVLEYVLMNIDQTDKQVKDLLKSIE